MEYATEQTRKDNIIIHNALKSAQSGNLDNAIELLSSLTFTTSVRYGLLLNVSTLHMYELADWLLERYSENMRHTYIEYSGREADHSRLQYIFYHACSWGADYIVRQLVLKYHADVNGFYLGSPEKAINNAVSSGNLELVSFLLDHGAIPHHTVNNCTSSYPLQDAGFKGNLPMCQLLVERGAMLNGLNAYGLSVLDYAEMGGHQETIEYLKSVGALKSWQIRGESGPPKPPPDPKNQREYIERHFGSHLQEFVMDQTRLDMPIRILQCRGDGDCLLLITEGMSRYPLPLDTTLSNPEEYQYGELYIKLPEEWRTKMDSWQSPRRRWVLDWMFRIARHFVENNQPLGKGALFSNEDPPEPLAEGLKYTSILIASPNNDYHRFAEADGRIIRYYWMNPIFTDEAEFVRKYGLNLFVTFLLRDGYTPHYFESRPSEMEHLYAPEDIADMIDVM